MKTITLEKARKMATHGELSSATDMVDVSDQAHQLLDNIGTTKEWQAIGLMDGEGMSTVVALCHPRNAALLAHCWNTHQKLVDALKDVRGAISILRHQCTDGGDVADILDSFIPSVKAALAEATTVTIPD